MTNAISEIASCEERTIKVTGAVSSGKTQALIERCIFLLEQGVSPDKIMVATATSFGAQAFARRLAAAASSVEAEQTTGIRVCTALQAITDTLDKPEIAALTGRSGRLLSDFEYNFLLEDMKTLGQPRRELRSMLRYFYRNWANLTPEADWLYGDSISVCGKLQGMTALLGAVSKFEAAYLCANFLMSPQGEPFRGAFDYVLCDDFQNLSRAEQTAICLHAKTQLIVAGDEGQWSKTSSDYPNPEGFQKFETRRRAVSVFKLNHTFGNGAIQKVAQSLSDAETEVAFDEDEFPVQRIKWLTPEEELIGITKYLRDQFNSDTTLDERTFCLVAPNKRFARMYQKALEKRGFKTSIAGLGNRIGGDPRTVESCPALAAYIKLNLIACPQDAAAWRAWCGLGDSLCNSQSFEGLYAYAGKHDRPLVECLKEVSDNVFAGGAEPFLRAKVLAKRYHEGIQVIQNNSARRGFNLLAAVGATGLPEFAEAESALTGSESAAEVFSLIRENVFFPSLPNALHTFNIVSYANMPGLNFDTIIVVGLVDGYMPKRDAFEVVSTEEDRHAVMEAEQRALYSTLGKAHTNLLLSYFTKCDLELAERTKMQVSRIRSEDGNRVASSRPSCFFTNMEQACPHTTSGQTLLAQRNLN